MATANVYEVRFQVVKAATAVSGPAWQYRLEPRKAIIQAASTHAKDLLAVLNADITLRTGEVIDILGVTQLYIGTEGIAALT